MSGVLSCWARVLLARAKGSSGMTVFVVVWGAVSECRATYSATILLLLYGS